MSHFAALVDLFGPSDSVDLISSARPTKNARVNLADISGSIRNSNEMVSQNPMEFKIKHQNSKSGSILNASQNPNSFTSFTTATHKTTPTSMTSFTTTTPARKTQISNFLTVYTPENKEDSVMHRLRGAPEEEPSEKLIKESINCSGSRYKNKPPGYSPAEEARKEREAKSNKVGYWGPIGWVANGFSAVSNLSFFTGVNGDMYTRGKWRKDPLNLVEVPDPVTWENYASLAGGVAMVPVVVGGAIVGRWVVAKTARVMGKVAVFEAGEMKEQGVLQWWMACFGLGGAKKKKKDEEEEED